MRMKKYCIRGITAMPVQSSSRSPTVDQKDFVARSFICGRENDQSDIFHKMWRRSTKRLWAYVAFIYRLHIANQVAHTRHS